MEDLVKNNANCKNMPGYVGLHLVYDDEVESTPFVDTDTRFVNLVIGKTWGNVPAREISLVSQYQGGAYSLEINGILHATRISVMELRLQEMTQKKFLARLVDRNGDKWIAGMKDEPLNFEYEHIGDSDPTGTRAYRIRLFRSTTYPVMRLYEG